MLRLERIIACSVLAAAAATPAQAQTDPERREQARQFASKGFDALQKRDYATAEANFRRADALVHAPTLVVDHARALTGLGRLVEAHERYELVLREGVAPNSPWQWQRAYHDAERELTALKPRLSWLKLEVHGPRTPTVRIDGRAVPAAALGIRRATDPGTHVISVSAPGYLPREEIVNLDEGGNASLELTLEPDQTGAAAPKPEKPKAVATDTEPRTQTLDLEPVETSERDDTFAYVAFGVGGVALATGAVTGFLFLKARSDLDEECANQLCRPRTNAELATIQDRRNDYRLWGTISGVALGVGVAGAATGAAMLVFATDSEPEPQKADDESATPARMRAAVRPFELRVGLGSVSLRGAF